MELSKFNKDLAQEIITKLKEASELVENVSLAADSSSQITLSLDELEALVVIQCAYMNCNITIKMLQEIF